MRTERAVAGISAVAASAAAAYFYFSRRPRDNADPNISAVLEFWFGGASIDELYDTRWFVADKSPSQLKLDAEVRERFGDLLSRAERGELTSWSNSARGVLALIVVLDQLSRHAHRGDRAQIEANDVEALRLAQFLLARGWDESLESTQLIFALMPLRHTPTESRLREVLDRTAPRLAECESGARLLHRFRKHTELRLLHLEGRGDPDDILECCDLEHDCDQSGAADEPLARCVRDFLLEHAGVSPSSAPPPQQEQEDGCVAGGEQRRNGANGKARGGQRQRRNAMRDKRERTTTVQSSTHTNGESSGSSAAAAVGANGDEAVGEDDAAPPPLTPPALIVSLSGGVDSMALVHILLALKAKYAFEYSVHAVHIDYGNRDESAAEAEFVKSWCARRGVSIRVRVVDEVKRDVTARDVYEARSREIRFNEYVQAMSQWDGHGVFFGHHEGDLHENVISNVMKGAQLLNIAGISASSYVSGVRIYRPMLPYPKSVILDYAHKYGVAYFKDTTPKWSTRGKLRNKLQPLLKEVYGEGVNAHLTSLAKDSAQCAALVEAHMLRPFWASVVRSNAAVKVDVGPYVGLPIFFWREALRHVCEQMLGSGLVKERPIYILMERLGKVVAASSSPSIKCAKDGWLALKRENRSLLVGTTLVLFGSHIFPGRHEGRVWHPEAHAPEGTPIEAPVFLPTVAQLGAWTVRLTRFSSRASAEAEDDDSEDGGNGGSNGGAPAALWRVVSGRIAYTLPMHASYAVGSSTHAQVESLKQLKGETWGLMMGAFPQIIPVGEPTGGDGCVRVEILASSFK